MNIEEGLFFADRIKDKFRAKDENEAKEIISDYFNKYKNYKPKEHDVEGSKRGGFIVHLSRQKKKEGREEDILHKTGRGIKKATEFLKKDIDKTKEDIKPIINKGKETVKTIGKSIKAALPKGTLTAKNKFEMGTLKAKIRGQYPNVTFKDYSEGGKFKSDYYYDEEKTKQKTSNDRLSNIQKVLNKLSDDKLKKIEDIINT